MVLFNQIVLTTMVVLCNVSFHYIFKAWIRNSVITSYPSKHLLVLKTSSKCFQDLSWRRLQHVFSVTILRLRRRLKDVLQRRLEDVLEDVLKTSCKTSWRRLGRRKIVTLKTSWRRLKDISWRRLEEMSWRGLEDMSWRRLGDMSWRRIEDMSWRRLEDMSWRSLEFISWGRFEDTMKTNKILTEDICI